MMKLGFLKTDLVAADHFLGGEKGVVGGHSGVLRRIHLGLRGVVVELIPLDPLDLKRSESLMRALPSSVPSLPACIAQTYPLTGFANLFLGVGHQPPWL